MKCHYEVLGVGRDANDDEIKKSYRKLALKWHPDKNINSPEVAREHFQLIQQAYEVLIDSHERCFYDNHREQILRGKNSNYEDNSLDVFQYFTVTCFKGYDDDPNGFYHVYAEIFEKIASEDAEFLDDEEDILNVPKFGNSQSNYENIVGPFYAYWQSYCTKKTYTWLCKYDITEIKDRRILREIEKETKKIAQKAKKERNEEIRNLVSFVRKRDKRVQAYRIQLEEKAEQNRKKQELNRIEQIRKRQRELEEMKNSNIANVLKPDGYEDQLRQLEQEYGDESDYDDDDDNDEDESCNDDVDENNLNGECDEIQYFDDLYCIACNKAFKNENAFINHEISQKHLTNVDKLKTKMALEEKEYLIEDGVSNDCDCNLEISDLDDTIEKHEELSINDKEKSEVEFQMKNESKKSKKKKSKKSQPSKVESDIEQEPDEIPDLLANLSVEKDDNWQDDNRKSAKKSKNKKSNKTEMSKTVNKLEPEETTNDIIKKVEPLKNSAKAAIVAKENNLIDITHVCVTCKAIFDSKNKLFTHLKKTNHGVYIPKECLGTTSINGNSGKKGKKK